MDCEGKLCVVIGAAGGLGGALVDKALESRMRVRAVVRPGRAYPRLSALHGVEVVEVDLLQRDLARTLEPILLGSVVIFCAARGRSRFSNRQDMPALVGSILEATVNNDWDMKEDMPPRLIITSCISTSPAGRSQLGLLSRISAKVFLRGHVNDFALMESLCTNDKLPEHLSKISVPEFTIVRPPILTDEAESNTEAVGFEEDSMQRIMKTIPRIAVANYMFKECFERDGHLRESVIVGLKA